MVVMVVPLKPTSAALHIASYYVLLIWVVIKLVRNEMDCEVMDVERTCRGCLREGGELRSLFTIDENSPQHEPRLNEMLMSSTQIQVKFWCLF